jgi:hypothetical protein
MGIYQHHCTWDKNVQAKDKPNKKKSSFKKVKAREKAKEKRWGSVKSSGWQSMKKNSEENELK